MRKTSTRRGFTLPEVLVTVTIVAVLAAVMVPAVINQVAKGDKPAVAQDFGAIRTAITTFAADTRHYPRNFDQLTAATLSAADSDIVGTTSLFGNDAANYRGPYLPTAPGPHPGPTGGFYSDRFQLNGSLLCMTDSSLAGPVSSVSHAVVQQADSSMDNGSGLATGIVTWTGTATTHTPGTVKVCLVAK